MPAPESLVIEGDNLPALRALLPAHRGTVKVVYIDPPYNTGNAHTYRDSFRSAHSAWLEFMRPRLELARELMCTDGVLFLHIDDREQAYAQILGHEIFGEANSLGTLIHQRAKGGGQAKFFVRGHDYIHVWAKDVAAAGPLVTEKKPPARYEVVGGERMLVEDDVLRVSFGTYTRGRERRLMYEDIETVRGPAKRAEIDRCLVTGELALRPWGEPDPVTGAHKHAVVRLTPAAQATSKLYSILRVMGSEGRADLEELGLGGVFGYPKPVELVRTLIEAVTWHDPEATVLDFFAGSGTTAQAVMEANSRDAGRRRFILVQKPEPVASTLRAGRGTDTGRRSGSGAAQGAGQHATGHPAAAQGTAALAASGTAGAAGAAQTLAEAPPAFTTISEFCAERVRRAAARWSGTGPIAFLRTDAEGRLHRG